MKRKYCVGALCIILLAALWFWRYTSLNEYYRNFSKMQRLEFPAGQWVPFGDDYIEIDMKADGYWIRVDDFKITDYEDFIASESISVDSTSRKPEKLCLVTISLKNVDSIEKGILLPELMLHGYDSYALMNWDILTAINPILQNYYGLQLLKGSECQLVLPFDLYEFLYRSSTWRKIDDYSFFLRITFFPTSKDIKLQ